MACSSCRKEMDRSRLLCKPCIARKGARIGQVVVDPFPLLLHILRDIKAAALKPGDAQANLKSKWHPCFMPAFNAFHSLADGRQPSYQHISPIYEVKGQCKGRNAWEFRLMSGEVVGDIVCSIECSRASTSRNQFVSYRRER